MPISQLVHCVKFINIQYTACYGLLRQTALMLSAFKSEQCLGQYKADFHL